MKGWHGKIQDMPLEKLDEIIAQTEKAIESKQIDLNCFKKIREDKIKSSNGMLKLAGYDDCIIGVSHCFGQEPIVAYDQDKICQKLISRDGMSPEEALEYLEYNMLGSGLGPGTPCFISPMTAAEVDELADSF